MKIGGLLDRGTYSAKLKDPRWEKFRAGYVHRHGAFCRSCKRANLTVQVHHLAYERSREPWEYADDELIMFCKDCHKEWHTLINSFKRSTGRIAVEQLKILVGALSVMVKVHDSREVCLAIAQLASEPGTIRRLQESWAKAQ